MWNVCVSGERPFAMQGGIRTNVLLLNAIMRSRIRFFGECSLDVGNTCEIGHIVANISYNIGINKCMHT